MGCAVLKSAPVVRLHIRCENCLREKLRDLPLPAGAAPPDDINDLVENGYLTNLMFECRHCGSVIGNLVDIGLGDKNG